MIKTLGSTERLYTLITRKPRIGCDPTGVRLSADQMKGKVVFDRVSFAYPSRPQNIVLQDFSLTLNPGESVGESGGGKSTVANLLLRFYDPQRGNIHVDNVNLKEMDVIWLRHNVGIVSQERKCCSCSMFNFFSCSLCHFHS